jgi:hypothetical protein
MRGDTENRAEKYIRNHRNFKRWVAFALCLSLFTGTVTIYLLNKPATAMTEEGAGQVGLVLETADADFEQGLIEQMENEEAESAKESENEVGGENTEEGENSVENVESEEISASEENGTGEGNNASENEQKTTESTEEISEDKKDSDKPDSSEMDSASNSASAKKNAGESSSASSASTEASSSSSDASSASKSSKSESSASSSASSAASSNESHSSSSASNAASSSSSVSSSASSTSSASDSSSSVDDDIEYIDKVEVKATLIDEFGQEIDPEKYTFIDLPEFEEQLILNDTENPPYANVKVKTGAFRTAVYQYVETTVDGKIIKGLKKDTVEGYVKKDSKPDSEEASDSAASLSATGIETEAGDEPELTTVIVYSYTTDGENYTKIENDTIVKFVYSLGTQTEFTYSDDSTGVKITATLQIPGAIPDDADLVVTAIDRETEGYNYDAYMTALNNNAETIASDVGLEDKTEYTENNTLMYDIAFMYDGAEIQPAEGAVSISIEFEDNQLTKELAVSNEEDIAVVHMPIKEEVKMASEITTTSEATEITAEDIEVKTLTDATAEVNETEKIEFSEDNFSVFAITLKNNKISAASAAAVIDFDYISSFGEAFDYGVVANTYVWGGDTESNVMVGKYTSSAEDVGASTNYANAGGNNYFGSVSGISTIRFHETPANIYLGSEAYSQYKSKSFSFSNVVGTNIEKNTDIDVASIIDGIESYYGRYEGLGSSFEAAHRDKGGTTIDLREYPSGAYVLTYTGDNIYIDDEKLNVYLNEGQYLILNCTSKNLTIGTYNINGKSSSGYVASKDESDDWITNAVIFNIINADSVTISNTCGTFIAPNSAVNCGSANAGTVVANEISANSEWHYHNHDLPSVYGASVTLKANKTVNGETPADDEVFYFDVYEWDSNSNVWGDAPVTSIQNALGDITFGYINYTKSTDVGTHYYKITERQEEVTDYSYDTTVYVASVTVSSTSFQKNNKYVQTYTATDPVYYKLLTSDADPTNSSNLAAITTTVPAFNNIKGQVEIELYKYLDNAAPGDLEFSFTVRVLNSGEECLTTLTDSLVNDNDKISFAFAYNENYITPDSKGNRRIYLVINENDSSITGVAKDNDYIIARIDYPVTSNQKIYYFKYSYTDTTEKGYIDNIESGDFSKIKAAVANDKTKKSANSIKNLSDVAFYNTRNGYLRIHKMVVNKFGSYIVRDSKNDSILNNVEFTITNKDTGAVIWFKGFVAKLSSSDSIQTAYEYKDGELTGTTYNVYYNDNAQWTIEGLPVGTYVVKEVADKYTFTYDPVNDTSSPVDSIYSRVTKYAVTTDKNGGELYNIGGDNYRKTFSVDVSSITELYDTGREVTITTDYDMTPTVQIANYYSNPMAPVMISKQLTGGTWNSDMAFTFTIESYGTPQNTVLSDGTPVEVKSSPLPSNTTFTVSGDGSSSEQKIFLGEIDYIYEGTYYYKVTEEQGTLSGITYDPTEYYVKVEVSKYHTTFHAEYTRAKQRNYSYSDASEEKVSRDNEDFYYLGANVTYYKDDATMSDSSKIVQTTEVRLKTDPNVSGTTYYGEYIISHEGEYQAKFVNQKAGIITVKKVWLNANGEDDSANHTALNLRLWRRSEGTNWQWVDTGRVVTLVSGKWEETLTDIELLDSEGKPNHYCFMEEDISDSIYIATYNYQGIDYSTSGESWYDMQVVEGGIDYGTLTITNKSMATNVLPATGGSGTVSFTMLGLFLAAFAIFGKTFFSIRENRC